MVELSRLHFCDHSSNGGGVIQIGIVQKQPFCIGVGIGVQVLQAGPFHGAGSTYQAVDFVAFFQQEFREVGTVLTSDAGDEGGFLGGSFFQFSVFRQ